MFEVVFVCFGVYGKGVYFGYVGNLFVDVMMGGSFNVYGVNGRKFLLFVLYDFIMLDCFIMVWEEKIV